MPVNELRVATVATERGKEIAIGELVERLNELIRKVNELEEVLNNVSVSMQ